MPSADVIAHLALLEHQRLLDQGTQEKEATEEVENRFRIDRQFFTVGFQRDSEEQPVQKYFFPFEIKWRFKKVGFVSVRLRKVYYSWEYCKAHYYGYFPGYERIWDWFVVAEKKERG